jgi:hypothetical protein
MSKSVAKGLAKQSSCSSVFTLFIAE